MAHLQAKDNCRSAIVRMICTLIYVVLSQSLEKSQHYLLTTKLVNGPRKNRGKPRRNNYSNNAPSALSSLPPLAVIITIWICSSRFAPCVISPALHVRCTRPFHFHHFNLFSHLRNGAYLRRWRK